MRGLLINAEPMLSALSSVYHFRDRIPTSFFFQIKLVNMGEGIYRPIKVISSYLYHAKSLLEFH